LGIERLRAVLGSDIYVAAYLGLESEQPHCGASQEVEEWGI